MVMPILLILAGGGAGLIWFLFILVNYKPDHRFAAISVIATMLILIGSLYLAYDLLEHKPELPEPKHGVLRPFTLFVTTGLVGVIILEPVIWLMMLGNDPEPVVALQVALTGGLLAGISGILIGIPHPEKEKQFFSLKNLRNCLVGAASGLMFCALFFSIFFLPSVIQFSSHYLMYTVIIGVPVGGFLGSVQNLISYDPSFSQKARPSVISRKNSLIGFVIGFFFWGFVLFLITPGLDNMILMVVLALASAAAGGGARFTFWWVDSLPEQVLESFRAYTHYYWNGFITR